MSGIGMGDVLGACHTQHCILGQRPLRLMREMLPQMRLGKATERTDPELDAHHPAGRCSPGLRLDLPQQGGDQSTHPSVAVRYEKLSEILK